MLDTETDSDPDVWNSGCTSACKRSLLILSSGFTRLALCGCCAGLRLMAFHLCAAALIHTNKPNRRSSSVSCCHFLTQSESTESSSDSATFNLCNLVSVQQLHAGHMIRLNTFK